MDSQNNDNGNGKVTLAILKTTMDLNFERVFAELAKIQAAYAATNQTVQVHNNKILTLENCMTNDREELKKLRETLLDLEQELHAVDQRRANDTRLDRLVAAVITAIGAYLALFRGTI